jgi:hypothetical protein
MGVLEPSGNGLYLLPHQPKLPPSPSLESSYYAGPRVALTAQCDRVLWHRRFGHRNMQRLHAQHTHGVPTSPTLASYVKNVSCDSCVLHKATTAPHNTAACAKPPRPLLNTSSDLWGPMNIPSPHSPRLCSSSTTTHYMRVRFLMSKDDSCSKLETILPETRHLHARPHSK